MIGETVTLAALRTAHDTHMALSTDMPDFDARNDASAIECQHALALVPTSNLERVALIKLFLAFEGIPDSTARMVLDSLRVGCLPIADRVAAEIDRFVFAEKICGSTDDLDRIERLVVLDGIEKYLQHRRQRGQPSPAETVRALRRLQGRTALE